MFGSVYFNREENPSSGDKRPYAWLGPDRHPLDWSKPRPPAVMVGRQLLALVLVQANLFYPGEKVEVRSYERYLNVHPDEVQAYLFWGCRSKDFYLETLTNDGAIFVRKQLL